MDRWAGVLGVALVVVGAFIGYVSFQANTGIPLQSKYEVTALVPSSDRLISSADVRIGGVLVGKVVEIDAEPGEEGGEAQARLKLALDNSAGPLPADTTIQIRPASVLGLSYVDLNPGTSEESLPDGGTIPITQAEESIGVSDLLAVFDRESARSFRSAVGELGYGVAGRGPAINQSVKSTARLMRSLERFSRTVARPRTRFSEFLTGYEQMVAELDPVRTDLADLVSNGAETLDALSEVRGDLGAVIEAAPGAELATTTAFRRARPALAALAELAEELEPAGARLKGALGGANAAARAGVPVTWRLSGVARRLRPALEQLDSLARVPETKDSMRKLAEMLLPTRRFARHVADAEQFCHALSLWSQTLGGALAAIGPPEGPALPSIAITSDGAQAEAFQQSEPSPDLHSNPIPNVDARECESNNEPWAAGEQQLNNPKGLQSRRTRPVSPPPGVRALAEKAGLLDPIRGGR